MNNIDSEKFKANNIKKTKNFEIASLSFIIVINKNFTHS